MYQTEIFRGAILSEEAEMLAVLSVGMTKNQVTFEHYYQMHAVTFLGGHYIPFSLLILNWKVME